MNPEFQPSPKPINHVTTRQQWLSWILLALSIPFFQAARSQNFVSRWQYSWGGNRQDDISDMIPIDGNQYFFAGEAASDPSCNKTAPLYGGEDFAVFVLDDNGNKVWENTYGGVNDDRINSAVKVPGGGYLLVGSSESGISGTKTTPAIGGADIWVVCIDNNGNKLWDKTYGTDQLDIPFKVIATSDGGFLITGLTLGATATPNYGRGDYLALKIDAAGNQQWMKNYGSSEADEPHGLVETTNGNFLICGTSLGGNNGVKTSPAFGGYDLWLVCLAPDGMKLWDKSFGTVEDDFRGTLLKLNDGNYLITGMSPSAATIRKIDGSGNLIWQKYCGGNNQDAFEVATQDANGDIYVAGESATNSQGCKSSPFNGGGPFGDYWLTIFDQNGNKLSDLDYGGNDADLITNVTVVNGDVFLTGWSDSHISGNKTTDNCYQTADGWVVRLSHTLYIHDPTPVDICSSATGYNVDFTAYNNYSLGNIFTVQLSDANGLFGSPVDIGSKTSLGSDQMAITIPGATPVGSNYKIRVIASLPKDTSSTYPLWIHGPPAVNLGNDTGICENLPLELSAGTQAPGSQILWSDASTQPTLSVVNAGTYSCQVTNGCGSTQSTIHITAKMIPVSAIGNDTSFCSGDQIILQSRPEPADVKYLWSNGVQTSSISVGKAGTYWLETSNSCGSTRDTLKANQLSLPVSMLNKNPFLCEGTARILDAGAGNKSYQWNDGSTGSTLTVQATGIYWVQIINNNNCRIRDTADLSQIVPTPANFLPADTSICPYSSLLLKPHDFFESYEWSTGEINNSISAKATALYWLEATDAHGCTGRDSISIVAKDCPNGFYMPTAFTPNHDGKNDLCRPVIFGNFSNYKFTVFNRWGQKVFESELPNAGWDGAINGEPVDEASFVWICRFQFAGEPPRVEKGTTVLVR